MSRWADIEADEPDFAARVSSLMTARKHKVLATLRRDGSPRVSGIEAEFSDGDLVMGMMPDSVKLADVRRDPRIAIHVTSEDPGDDPAAWSGDVKVSGRVADEGATQSGPEGSMFRVDIAEVVLTRVGTPADHLVIESWHPERGYRRRQRT